MAAPTDVAPVEEQKQKKQSEEVKKKKKTPKVKVLVESKAKSPVRVETDLATITANAPEKFVDVPTVITLDIQVRDNVLKIKTDINKIF